MSISTTFKQAHSEIQRGMRLSKCRKCGCMRGTLENLKTSLPALTNREAAGLLTHVKSWLKQLEPQEYPCFGCKYCIPPEAMTMLTSKIPALASSTLSSCEFQASDDSWPAVEGEYSVLDKTAPVALSTLASVRLEEKLAIKRPAGLCIIGKTETENIGIDKIVKNVITNPAISFLIIAGKDTEGHQSGRTLLALWKNGVGKDMRVIGSSGRRPVLKNVTLSEVKAFRKQVQVDDMIGCENTGTLAKRIKELSQSSMAAGAAAGKENANQGCGCHDCSEGAGVMQSRKKTVKTVPKITAKRYGKSSIKLDKAGYFVILPSKKNGKISVEHYSYENRLLRTIEGKKGRDIYLTIVSNKWIKDLGHAAYLGKELARAELSIQKGFKFVQDGA
jgi:tetrahydromethanopterin S-methyltransferase subunit A